MKTGLAAQSTSIFSGKQAANTSSSEINTSDDSANPDPSTAASSSKTAIPAAAQVDSGRAKTPVLNTGVGTGQTSVITQAVEKEETTQAKRLPWEQQSAQKSAENKSTESDQEVKTENTFPWQQQSSAKTETTSSEEVDGQGGFKEKLPWSQQSASQANAKVLPKESSSSSSGLGSESRIRHMIIDPETGLYVETGLNSINNLASERSNMSFDNRQEDLLEWPFWEMDGRIGLTVAKDSYNGSVAWEQNNAAIDFRFRGPLGFGGVRIHGDLDDQVRVKTTTGQDFTVSNFETEMQARMGWSIPINSLRYWALGIVDPEIDADVVLNEEDLLDELVQGDWKVVYERYKEVDGVQLPSKFKITGPDTKIKMIVNDWSIPAAE